MILLTAPLDRTLIVRIPAYAPPRVGAQGLTGVLIASGTRGGRLLKEKVEELVGDAVVGLLLELLEGGKAEEEFEEGEGGADLGLPGLTAGGGGEVGLLGC